MVQHLKESGILPEQIIEMNFESFDFRGMSADDIYRYVKEMCIRDSTDAEEEPCAVCISMPKSLFTDSNLENLKALIAAKGSLIKKALGVSGLPLEITDAKVSFPWFPATPTPDEMNAYDTFICKLCEMARNQKRVSAAEKPTDNEKYAFRCFLLRLGFIGAEYKTARKILLKNLSGSSAFKNGGAQHEISE